MKDDHQLDYDEVDYVVKKFPLCILANDIKTPTNIGSVFRIADGLGVSKIYLTGCTPVPPDKKINRTARSTVKFVDHEYCESALELISKLKQDGYKILSLEITANSTDISKFKVEPSDKICLIIGTERFGIDKELLKASDQAVHIPMHGQNLSLNVAIATGIAVFQLVQLFDRN